MTIAKKQFEFVIRGRVLALDSAGALAAANLQPVIDGVVLSGVEYDLNTPSALTGAPGEQFTYPTLVADLDQAPTNVALAGTMAAVKTLVTTLKGIA